MISRPMRDRCAFSRPIAVDWHETVVELLDAEPDYSCPYSMARVKLKEDVVQRLRDLRAEGHWFVVITGARRSVKEIIENQAKHVFIEPTNVFTQSSWAGFPAMVEHKKAALQLSKAILLVDDREDCRDAAELMGVPAMTPEAFVSSPLPWDAAELAALSARTGAME